MIRKMNYGDALKDLLKKIEERNLYSQYPFCFVSYSHSVNDVDKIYPFLKQLFEAGYLIVLDSEYAEMNDSWVNGMTRRVCNKNCKLMLTFTSESYIYSRPSLIEQYCRYSDRSRKCHGDSEIPCYVVDTVTSDFSYMTRIHFEVIDGIKRKNAKENFRLRENSESAICLREGLKGFYPAIDQDDMNIRIINREYEALQVFDDIDEIRRQMYFILNESGCLNDLCSISDQDAFEKVIHSLEENGIPKQEEISRLSEDHFRNWGFETFDYIRDGKILATMKYHPAQQRFILLKGQKDGENREFEDINSLTQVALSTKDPIVNPEVNWIHSGDGHSFNQKYGFFTDYDLTPEQENILDKVIEKVDIHYGESSPAHGELGHLIFVQGEAGTGKTVLVQKIFRETMARFKGINCYFVVNNDDLVSQYQNELNKFGIDKKKVNRPIKILNSLDKDLGNGAMRPDIIFVDEAHLMNTRKCREYTNKNKNFIVADNMVSDLRRLSKTVLLMFDENQIISGKHWWNYTLLENLIDEAVEKGDYALLKRQMRIEAGEEVIDWISSFVQDHKINKIPSGVNYKIKIFNSVKEMHETIKQYAADETSRNSRLAATYDWPYSSLKGAGPNKDEPWYVTIESENWKMPWNREHEARKECFECEKGLKKRGKGDKGDKTWINQEYSLNEVGSVFTVQGFDMAYVGVILGESLTYDPEKQEIKCIPENCQYHDITDNQKSIDELHYKERLIWNHVNILLTRGRRGLFIYAVDEGLRKALLEAASE